MRTTCPNCEGDAFDIYHLFDPELRMPWADCLMLCGNCDALVAVPTGVFDLRMLTADEMAEVIAQPGAAECLVKARIGVARSMAKKRGPVNSCE